MDCAESDKCRLGSVFKMYCWLLKLWILSLLCLLSASGLTTGELTFSDGGAKEYCQLEVFNASCAENEVIVMTSAMYGRMRFGRCMKEDHGNKGCSGNVISYMDRKCSGRRSCNVPIPNSELTTMSACPQEIVKYLEASYGCIRVASGNHQTCQFYGGVLLTADFGYLHSAAAVVGESGVEACPWIIEVSQGRKIHLTLFNFDTSISSRTNVDGSPPTSEKSGVYEPCDMYIAVEDGIGRAEIFLCERKMRQSALYSSMTSSLRIYVRAGPKSPLLRFLIKYEATGCPDVTSLPNASVERDGDRLTVKCNYTGQTYFLSCNGNDWIGEINNCTKRPSPLHSPGRTRFPYGLLIVIGIGVALGVAVGIIMLFGILFCLRKRKEETTRSATTDPLLSEITPHDSEDTHSSIYERRSQYAGGGMASLYRTSRTCRTPDLYAAAEAAELQRMPRPSWGPVVDRNLYGPHRNPKGDEGEPLNRKPKDDSHKQQGSTTNAADMQTSFITFKPPSDIAPGIIDTVGLPQRTLSEMHTAASVDLVKDSQPPYQAECIPPARAMSQYRELNPETLVLECTCSLRHGQGSGRAKKSHSKPCQHVQNTGNKSI